jgi:predicted CopG family antitoxin
MEKKRTIQVNEEEWDRLWELKGKRESLADVVRRLLAAQESGKQ